LYRGLGFGLPRGLVVFLGDVLALPALAAMFLSLISLGMGGTGGTPFCPATTTRDFRREDFAASRNTVFGEGWPEDIVPEADDPIPESRSESRLDVGDGEGVLDGGFGFFRVGRRVEFIGVANFFSKVEAVRVGRGSSSLTMMVWFVAWGG